MLRMQSAQRSMLEFEKQHPNSTKHYRHFALEISGNLDVVLLQQAFSKVISRHSTLRSSAKDDLGLRASTEFAQTPIQVVDATTSSKHSIEDIEQTLNDNGHDDFFNQPFDLQQPSLWRCALIKTNTNEYQLVLVIHPLIADDRSISILFNEISTYYNGLHSQHLLELPRPVPTEGSAALAHSPTILNKDLLSQSYWQDTLSDNNHIELPTTSATNTEHRGKKQPITLSATLVDSLKRAYPDNSLNDIFLAGIYTLLYKYTGETDITLGNSIDNRSSYNRLINGLANLLPLRLQFSDTNTFNELLTNISQVKHQATNNQLPISDIHELLLNSSQDQSFHESFPFDILVTVNHLNLRMDLNECETTKPIELDRGHCNFHYFEIKLNHFNDSACDGHITYNASLFNQQSIDRLIGHLEMLLQSMAKHPDAAINQTPILLESELTLLQAFNQSKTSPQYDMLVPDAFNQIAGSIAERTALAFHASNDNTQRISYAELEELSNKISSHLLQNYRLQTGDRVAISLKRSTNLVATMLGALKAGLVIVPLETEQNSLFQFKLKNAHAKLIIADDDTYSLFDRSTISVININNPKIQKRINLSDDTYYSPDITGESPAYVMYSSGTSTGIPKGIQLTHAGFANLLNALHDQSFPKQLKIICTALPTFDAFLFDFLTAWVTGGTVHLSSDDTRYDPQTISNIIKQEQINFAVFLPDLMMWLSPDLPLKTVLTMGRAPMETTLKEWLAADATRTIINGLGHTETGICLSLQKYQEGLDCRLVGGPISNMQMHVLNPDTLAICPIGIPGELYVSGPGLASEYIDNAALTETKFKYMSFDQATQRFMPSTPDNPEAIKMFASGDAATHELTPSGEVSIKLIGRTDRQVKIYGNSINMDGVEAMIGSCDFVKTVAVTLNNSKNGLHAYVVIDEQKLEEQALKSDVDYKKLLLTFLETTPLPSVAYPQFSLMVTLPQTANGKINYRQLPPPPKITFKPSKDIDVHAMIEQAWKTVLNIPANEKIKDDVTFEQYGGNSLKFLALQGKINDGLNLSRSNELNLYTVLKLSARTNDTTFRQRRNLGKNMTIFSLQKAVQLYLTHKRNTIRSANTSPFGSPYNSSVALYVKSPQERKTNDNRSEITLTENDETNYLKK